MADPKRDVSPHDPGGVGQTSETRRDGTTHHTTWRDDGWRHSHSSDKNGNEIPGTRHTTPPKK
jgi:hypothetical protein